jgi:hypothetical protein
MSKLFLQDILKNKKYKNIDNILSLRGKIELDYFLKSNELEKNLVWKDIYFTIKKSEINFPIFQHLMWNYVYEKKKWSDKFTFTFKNRIF